MSMRTSSGPVARRVMSSGTSGWSPAWAPQALTVMGGLLWGMVRRPWYGSVRGGRVGSARGPVHRLLDGLEHVAPRSHQFARSRPRPGGELGNDELSRRIHMDHLPEDADRRIAAVRLRPPLVAVAAFRRAIGVVSAHRGVHPFRRHPRLAVDASAGEHELTQPGV